MLFTTDTDVITKFPLLEPCRGTQQLTKDVIDASDTVPMLLAKLADASQNVTRKDVSYAT